VDWILSIAAVLSAPAALQEQAAPRELSALVEPLLTKHSIPGMACAIVDSKGTLLATGAAGVRKKGDPTPITASDEFHLGSCTKAMTATLIAMLVEEQELAWDARVAEFWTGKVPEIHENWKDVTLEQLLQHRGGAPEHLEIKGLWWRLKNHAGTPVQARLDLVAGVLPQAPRSAPGTAFLYSNAGYAIAGAMAETVAGKPWEELIRERLFVPLGMTSAGFGPPGSAGKVDQPWGHKPDGFAVDPGAPHADNPPAIGPAGTVHATLADWAKFVALHMAAERGAPRLLSAESFARLHAVPAGGEYACGWFSVPRGWAGKQRALNHAGSNTQWYCVVWAAPERDFAVLVACNIGARPAERACDELASRLIQDQLDALTRAKSER
jgi:CubicO group peptidase (beta-lactamase class C family)